MKLFRHIALPLWMAFFAAGCTGPSIEQLSRELIVPAAIPGQAMAFATGSGEQLLNEGRIDSHLRVPVADGAEMDVWVINHRTNAPARGTVVLLHPLLVGKTWFLGLGTELADRGWNIALMDLRAHGQSGGQYITWGAKEKHDVKAVVDRLLSDGGVSDQIYAVGASLGGSVAIQYAAIDPRVRGVMAVAPPESGREITRRLALMQSQSKYDAALALAEQTASFDIDDASALDAAAKLQCPLLLVHGFLDVVVPYQHSQRLRGAAKQAELVTLPIDGHAPEILRDNWMADRVDKLAEMAAEDQQK